MSDLLTGFVPVVIQIRRRRNPNHRTMSAVFVGRCQRPLHPGRTVRCGPTHRRPGNGNLTGRPFNQLLTSVARGMDVDVDSVGLRSVTSGGNTSVTVDLTGEAPLLRV